jgi:hypothetical protein
MYTTTKRFCQARWCHHHPKGGGLNGAVFLLFHGLLPNVPIDLHCRKTGTEAPDKIPSHPYLATPVMLFQPGISLEQELRRDAFQGLSYCSGSNPWGRAGGQVDVVRQALCLADDNVVMRRNGAKHGRDFLAGQGIGKNTFAVFRTPGKVIPQFVSSLGSVEDRHLVFRVSHRPGFAPLLRPL